jgi:hypothetical protein
MHTHRTPIGLEEHALIDRALLMLMLGTDPGRIWAEDELARAVELPGDVRDGLRRLRTSRLIHRWNDLSTPSRPAIRMSELHNTAKSAHTPEREDDRTLLGALLVRSSSAVATMAETDAYDALGGTDRPRVTSSLGRLASDGLIERRGGRVIPSEVARRFDELMSLAHSQVDAQ